MLLEEVLGAEKTALTGVVRQAVSGIKRELARTRGEVKKATGYSFQIIQYLVEKEIVPFWTSRTRLKHLILTSDHGSVP